MLVFISQESCILGEVRVSGSQEGIKVRRRRHQGSHRVWEVIVSVCALSLGPSKTGDLSILIHLHERSTALQECRTPACRAWELREPGSSLVL